MKYRKPLENYVVYLNTEQNCVKRYNSGNTKTIEYTWDISPIVLSEYAVVKLISIAHDVASGGTGHGDNPLVFHIKDLQFNPELYRSSEDCPYPIIFGCAWRNNETSYWNGENGGVFVIPQTIRRISMIVSDDLLNSYAGISKDLQFIIGLSVQQYERRWSDVEN